MICSRPPDSARPPTNHAAHTAAKNIKMYAPFTNHEDQLPLVIR